MDENMSQTKCKIHNHLSKHKLSKQPILNQSRIRKETNWYKINALENL